MAKSVTFTLDLIDDDSVAEKLSCMDVMEVMFDDERNYVPDTYWDIVDNMLPGQSLRISIDLLDSHPSIT